MANVKITELPVLSDPQPGDVLEVTDDPGGTPASRQIALREIGGVFHIRDEKPSGTDGGAATADTWHTRDLNTTKVNQITGASVAGNQITLPAGAYRISARAPTHRVDRHMLRWRNITDGTTVMVGSSEISNDADLTTTSSVLRAWFTITATKVFELQHYIELAQATFGLGVSVGSGETEVYADIWIERHF